METLVEYAKGTEMGPQRAMVEQFAASADILRRCLSRGLVKATRPIRAFAKSRCLRAWRSAPSMKRRPAVRASWSRSANRPTSSTMTSTSTQRLSAVMAWNA